MSCLRHEDKGFQAHPTYISCVYVGARSRKERRDSLKPSLLRWCQLLTLPVQPPPLVAAVRRRVGNQGLLPWPTIVGGCAAPADVRALCRCLSPLPPLAAQHPRPFAALRHVCLRRLPPLAMQPPPSFTGLRRYHGTLFVAASETIVVALYSRCLYTLCRCSSQFVTAKYTALMHMLKKNRVHPNYVMDEAWRRYLEYGESEDFLARYKQGPINRNTKVERLGTRPSKHGGGSVSFVTTNERLCACSRVFVPRDEFIGEIIHRLQLLAIHQAYKLLLRMKERLLLHVGTLDVAHWCSSTRVVHILKNEISAAQDKFISSLQRIYLNQPDHREIIRLIMATVGRGGHGDLGQRIRDEILLIQKIQLNIIQLSKIFIVPFESAFIANPKQEKVVNSKTQEIIVNARHVSTLHVTCTPLRSKPLFAFWKSQATVHYAFTLCKLLCFLQRSGTINLLLYRRVICSCFIEESFVGLLLHKQCVYI
ncbi:hypothetical protein Syun_001703 [Stephania yunnanensis]|uniref:Uncharacterized protein n=1 Tax=Stephania yunnanensis TaxID=152371 RepID=A0AAP0LFB5_9MAGN